MKRLALLLVTSLIAVSGIAQAAADGAGSTGTPASKAHVLSNEELDKLLAQPGKVLVIDVRRPDEISTIGGLPVYLSIQLKDLENRLDWIPKDRILVTFSNHAGRASKAAELLTSKGFNVAGAAGAETYEKAGGTLAHIAIPPPNTAQNAGQTASAKD
ncbi:MAG: rhodanese-like domain-containing protein [Steroidobacteraceae bacterium]|jgi:rhodanese-related sulfurtransferase